MIEMITAPTHGTNEMSENHALRFVSCSRRLATAQLGTAMITVWISKACAHTHDTSKLLKDPNRSASASHGFARSAA